MSNTIKLKRSNVPGKVPTLVQLTAGELAMNTNDEKLFFSSGANIIEVAHQLQVDSIATELTTKLNSSDYNATDVLAKLLTVDGHTSGLNADMLDGHHYSDFQLQSAELDAIAGLVGTTGFLKKTGVGTYTLDTNSYINVDQLGSPNGVATLDATGKVTSSQLPSYVDDVLEYADLASFPVTGETSKIYIALNTDRIYRWSGSTYVEVSSLGIADAALKLNTPRSISATGDASWSVNFDGSADVTSALTLATVNANVGTFAGITVNAKGLVTGATVLTTLAGYGIADAAPLSHVSDETLHLTTAQNTWIDAITASSTEVNYLTGVTSAIQTQLNGKQPLESKLTSISGLNNTTTGLLKFTNGTASYDTNNYVLATAGVGTVLQTLVSTYTPVSGTTLIALGATPTTADGTQLVSNTISVQSTSSKVKIELSSFVDVGNNGKIVVLSLFRGTTCIYATAVDVEAAGKPASINLEYVDSPATTGNVTYTIRIGASTATTWYIGQIRTGSAFPNADTNTVTFTELS